MTIDRRELVTSTGYVSMTVRQYARLEGLHPITVYRRAKAGMIAGVVRHGRSIRIHVPIRVPRETTVSPR
jgi:hypothetical protein